MHKLWLILLSVLWCSTASAQLWSGVLDPSRASNWTVAGVTGGIPTNRTQCGSTIAAYGTIGSPQSAATINTAIMNCSNNGGGYILLGPGTFYLSDGITFTPTANGSVAKNVTLRGSGPDQTTLYFTGTTGMCTGESLICIADSTASGAACAVVTGYAVVPSGNIATWTAGYTAGTTKITADTNAGSLTAGMYVFLDQLDDPTSNATAYAPFTTGASPAALYPNNSGRGQNSPSTARQIMERHKVTAVTPSGGSFLVTISPPVAYTRFQGGATYQPQIWWCGNTSQVPVGDGVESLTINNQSGGGGPWGNVQFFQASEGWVKNVRSLNGGHAHIHTQTSSNIEIRDSYFYGENTTPGGGTIYGANTNSSSFVKTENNIFQQVTSSMITNNCGTCVIGYNFDVASLWKAGSNFLWASYQGHTGGTHQVLLEGNDANGTSNDHASAHANSALMSTHFRNKFTGTEPGYIGNNVVNAQGWQRFNSYIGNVLGTSGYHTNYEDSLGPQGVTGDPIHSIYYIGWPFLNESTASPGFDMITLTSMMRWGNFDYVTNGVRWNSNEVPSDNPVPATHNLPASFYLSSKPAWFGSAPWPAIGPDVTGGTDVSGHAANIPAKRCYLNVMQGPADGSGGVLTFNGDKCYPSGGGTDTVSPQAPKNLQIL